MIPRSSSCTVKQPQCCQAETGTAHGGANGLMDHINSQAMRGQDPMDGDGPSFFFHRFTRAMQQHYQDAIAIVAQI